MLARPRDLVDVGGPGGKLGALFGALSDVRRGPLVVRPASVGSTGLAVSVAAVLARSAARVAWRSLARPFGLLAGVCASTALLSVSAAL